MRQGPLPTGQSIFTERLELRSMPAEFFAAVFDGRIGDAETAQDIRLYDDAPLGKGAQFLHWRISALRAVPEIGDWIGRSFVRKSDSQVIGDGGFLNPPGLHPRNREVPGLVELGYFVSSEFRNQRYVTEACRALIDWAHIEHDVSEFQIQVKPDNTASRRVAEKLGFSLEGMFRHDYTGSDGFCRYRLRMTT